MGPESSQGGLIVDGKPQGQQHQEKVAFVTVGATAGFRPLVAEVVSPAFIETLKQLSFTQLIVQCGPDYPFFLHAKESLSEDVANGFMISGFDYTNHIHQFFRAAARGEDDHNNSDEEGRGGRRRRDYGVIICHAGSGTILDALDYDAKIVTVSNSLLMDDHQLQLARRMSRHGYLLEGRLGHLAQSVEQIARQPPRPWPPAPRQDDELGDGIFDAIGGIIR
ncbi:hypothetical protein F4778DRAFT_739868 [Xylariomycetidae sp. FL2044]|nr:hypothetical protein F4778DRAFT_739868 [Xylariomycetidae sp. FL2044]